VLHVPDIGLVVAGDAAYNDVHQYLAESDAQGRQGWLAALDILEALDPRAVVAGHKRYGRDDNPRIIDETRQYIIDASSGIRSVSRCTRNWRALSSRRSDRGAAVRDRGVIAAAIS
jgi:hypothetical protein